MKNELLGKDERVWYLLPPFESNQENGAVLTRRVALSWAPPPGSACLKVVPQYELDRVKGFLDEAVPLLETARKGMYFEGSEVYEKRIEDLLQKLKGGE